MAEMPESLRRAFRHTGAAALALPRGTALSLQLDPEHFRRAREALDRLMPYDRQVDRLWERYRWAGGIAITRVHVPSFAVEPV